MKRYLIVTRDLIFVKGYVSLFCKYIFIITLHKIIKNCKNYITLPKTIHNEMKQSLILKCDPPFQCHQGKGMIPSAISCIFGMRH